MWCNNIYKNQQFNKEKLSLCLFKNIQRKCGNLINNENLKVIDRKIEHFI